MPTPRAASARLNETVAERSIGVRAPVKILRLRCNLKKAKTGSQPISIADSVYRPVGEAVNGEVNDQCERMGLPEKQRGRE
mgnify:CR=1 FL=1